MRSAARLGGLDDVRVDREVQLGAVGLFRVGVALPRLARGPAASPREPRLELTDTLAGAEERLGVRDVARLLLEALPCRERVLVAPALSLDGLRHVGQDERAARIVRWHRLEGGDEAVLGLGEELPSVRCASSLEERARFVVRASRRLARLRLRRGRRSGREHENEKRAGCS